MFVKTQSVIFTLFLEQYVCDALTTFSKKVVITKENGTGSRDVVINIVCRRRSIKQLIFIFVVMFVFKYYRRQLQKKWMKALMPKRSLKWWLWPLKHKLKLKFKPLLNPFFSLRSVTDFQANSQWMRLLINTFYTRTSAYFNVTLHFKYRIYMCCPWCFNLCIFSIVFSTSTSLFGDL